MGAARAYIRNIGHEIFKLDSVYVDGNKITGVNMADINAGAVGTLVIGVGSGPGQFSWQPSMTYWVKIVGKDGTHLIFPIRECARETTQFKVDYQVEVRISYSSIKILHVR